MKEMNALQRRLHDAASVLGAASDENGFEQLLRDAIAEIARLRAALGESCENHRAEVYDTTTGGGCVLMHDAVEAECERCAAVVERILSESPMGLQQRREALYFAARAIRAG